jgi:Arc/MetJ-type ribon-helix-helix transcriptional regulator
MACGPRKIPQMAKSTCSSTDYATPPLTVELRLTANRYRATPPIRPRFIAPAGLVGYGKGMKSNAKSSITLPPSEARLVQALKVRLKLKSNVEVVRRGLRLLQETTERRALREAYRAASRATRESLTREIDDLDHLSGEGLD